MKKLFLVGLIGLMGLMGSDVWGQKVSGEQRQRELYRQATDLFGKQK